MTNQTKKNPFGNISSILTESGGLNELLSNTNRFDIKLDDIEIIGQVRKEFGAEELQELADSIAARGVLQNIIVNEKENENSVLGYQLIAGERRFRAAKIAGLTKIPALVLKVSDEEALQIQILENIQRENLTAIDLANALEKELAALNGNQDELAAKYNKSRSWLFKAMQMNKITGNAQEVMTVSSDPEVILGIQQIEKTNPAKAEALVEQIKGDFGKKNVRKTVKAEIKKEKDEVKAKKSSGKPAPDAKSAPEPAFTLPSSKPEPAANAPKEYDLGGALDCSLEPETGISALDNTDSSTGAGTKDENQNVINFGEAIDLFCFKGKEVPDSVYDSVLTHNETFKALYDKAINEKNVFNYFLNTLKEAGFKLDSKNMNLQKVIELVILINSTDTFHLENITLNVRDILEANNLNE